MLVYGMKNKPYTRRNGSLPTTPGRARSCWRASRGRTFAGQRVCSACGATPVTTEVCGTPEPGAAPGADLPMAETGKRPGCFMIWEPVVQMLHSTLPDHENRKYERVLVHFAERPVPNPRKRHPSGKTLILGMRGSMPTPATTARDWRSGSAF